mgnify:CR=1 FL=1
MEKIDYREIGIALVNLAAREVSTNPSHVGKQMDKHVRCFP